VDPLDDIDLNLLRTLDVLLAERSVTRTAALLGRSQPAVSHALRRLRQVLDDPLLVRQGRGLTLTPRGEALADPVRRLMDDLRRTLAAAPTFDPATAQRMFVLAAPPLMAPLLPDLLDAMSVAPGARLELIGSRQRGAFDRADVVLDVLPDDASGVMARRVGALDQAVLHREHHPLTDRALTLDAWLAWPHVLVRTADALPSIVDLTLQQRGQRRDVGLIVSDLLLVPHVVARTDLLFTGPAQVLRPLCAPLGLVLRPTPLELPTVPVAAMWQERDHHDPGHRWFRERVLHAVQPHMAHAVDGAVGYR